MKNKLPLVAALAAALGSSGAIAQDQRPFEPQPPAQGGTPPPPTAPPPATPGPQATPPAPPQPPRGERPERPDRRGRGPGGGDLDQGRDEHDMHGGPGMRGGPGMEGGRMEGRRDREGGRPMFDMPPLKSEPQPFLGVVTGEIPPALGAQLGLPEGFGLLIQDVMPDSPAASAGIQKHDVLKSMNDQQLVNPAQLATLVHAAGKGADVSLTVIRKGQEQKLTAKLGEHMAPAGRPFDEAFGKGAPDAKDIEEHVRRMQERMREEQERGRRPQDGMRERMGRPGAGMPMPQGVPPRDLLKEARPDGGGQISVYSSNSVTKMDGSKARFTLKDADGSIDVSVDNGKRTLTAKNPNGDTVFEGPVNTDEEKQKVPEQFRKKLEQIRIQEQTSQPGTPGGSPSSGAQSGASSSAGSNTQ